jgi:hypothetical protein
MLDSGSSGRKVVEVRILSWTPCFAKVLALAGTSEVIASALVFHHPDCTYFSVGESPDT